MTKNAIFKTLIKNLIKTHQDPSKAFKLTKFEINNHDVEELKTIMKKFNIKDF